MNKKISHVLGTIEENFSTNPNMEMQFKKF